MVMWRSKPALDPRDMTTTTEGHREAAAEEEWEQTAERFVQSEKEPETMEKKHAKDKITEQGKWVEQL